MAVAPSLGRSLSGNVQTVVIDIIEQQQLFEKKYNQFDIRFIKSINLGGTRKLQGIFNIFNAFNSRPVLAVNQRFSGTTGGAWLTPTSTLIGRLIKFGVQFDF